MMMVKGRKSTRDRKSIDKVSSIAVPTHAPASKVEASLMRGGVQAMAYIRGDTTQGRLTRVAPTAQTTRGTEPPKITPALLKKFRTTNNLSQRILAGVLNVSPETVKGWEQGKKTPSGPAKRLIEVMQKHPALVEELTETIES